MKWLNDCPKGSVVYVSFGSFADLEVEQMEEIAWGLRMSSKCFLWVVLELEEASSEKLRGEDVREWIDGSLVSSTGCLSSWDAL
ncbi:hypothetical protein SLA2020_365380 [Shorea laevis]